MPYAGALGLTEAITPAVSAAGKKRPSLFESGYNDLILLKEGQLDNWKHYLDDNPWRLAIKRLYPDYFTTIHYMDIGEWHCQIVGNRFLLDIPQKVAVIVHKAYTDKEYADYKRQWLACGEAFEACSVGRLLQVSPWEYHMEKRVISREQCLTLNRLVEYIATENIRSSKDC